MLGLTYLYSLHLHLHLLLLFLLSFLFSRWFLGLVAFFFFRSFLLGFWAWVLFFSFFFFFFFCFLFTLGFWVWLLIPNQNQPHHREQPPNPTFCLTHIKTHPPPWGLLKIMTVRKKNSILSKQKSRKPLKNSPLVWFRSIQKPRTKVH